MALLFIIAQYAERQTKIKDRSLASHPAVYALSMAVYCTTWTFYGSVGKAVTSGPLFLTIYLGPTLCVVLWWTVLRKLVRIKSEHRITSIADFISARYDRSQLLAVLATLGALFGTTPYVALQLKSVITTFSIISPAESGNAWIGGNVGPVVVVLMIVFTIIFGVRRIDPTERHQGMVMAVAVESVVKLVAFLAAGLFVTYFLYDGFGDVLQRLGQSTFRKHLTFSGSSGSSYLTWTSYLILGMSAILFLPRQFHVAVVENSNEKSILSAMWLFPLYMLLINIFVIPIAMGGLLAGMPVQQADTFVLRLPMESGHAGLTLLVFIGGFSAATGMIMITAMTMATMITNHLLLPLLESSPSPYQTVHPSVPMGGCGLVYFDGLLVRISGGRVLHARQYRDHLLCSDPSIRACHLAGDLLAWRQQNGCDSWHGGWLCRMVFHDARARSG
jgi:Na+/proline symporter